MLDNLQSLFEAVLVGDKQAIILLTAIYFAAMGLFGLVYCLRVRSWPITNGVLLNSGLKTFSPAMRSDEQNYEIDVRYSYSVAGEEYEGRRLSPTYIVASSNLRFLLKWQMRGITKLSAENVAVFYNPSNPKKSFLIKPGAIVLSFLTGMTLISVIVLIMSI